MDLLFGKLVLMDYEGTELRHRYPSAETFALLADQLAGVDSVTRLEVPERPSVFLFEVHRSGRATAPGRLEPARLLPRGGRAANRVRLAVALQHRPRPSTPWVRCTRPP